MKLPEKNILPLLVTLGAVCVAAPGMRMAAMVATAATLALIARKAAPVREPARVRATTSYRAKRIANLRKRF